MRNTKWAILKDVQGVTSETSLTAWAGEPFKTYHNCSVALSECTRVNNFYRENGVKDIAYVAEGHIDYLGFHPLKEE